MAGDRTDFDKSGRSRRHSWYGAKPTVKRVLSWRVPHAVVRTCASMLDDRIRSERLPAPARVHEVEAHMAGVSFVMKDPDRCVIAKELYWGHGVRPRPADQLALDVFAALAKDAKLILDVGAYTGLFSILGARVAEDAQVHAFEVVPAVAKAALDNVVANDLLRRVTVHIQGVGKDGDSTRIAVGDGGSALPDFYSTELYFEHGVDVPVYSLDAIMHSMPESVRGAATLVKIDVEGTEDVVLQNAQEFLEANRPDILCEVLPDSGDADRVATALAPHGYRLLRVEPDTLVEYGELSPSIHCRDWLFTTKSDAQLAAAGVPLPA
ncbi:FkbM family methyltransferase [Phytoactinopolyspora halotolerans]|uniref:FkbM family methyltransferase n=1 Tax=Phytoactinopolyspora halotolerans TaxID=1981512 RepID=A0A6L9S4V9_9ACTN|nr:FkbM family methyltransferase [Phytoactinopolyspora halotolerans]NED99069.1 FkbM family methyltransferase [Phytoactinopolyspora halotolerans]